MFQVDQSTLLLLGALAAALVLWRRHVSRLSIGYVSGPKASWLYGNMKDFAYQKNVGDMDFQFVKQYGRVWRMQGPLGRILRQVIAVLRSFTHSNTQLYTQALHHCVHKADEVYIKRVETTELFLKMTGKGLVWASGSIHERQRKIIGPAFSNAQIRSFLPFFRAGAAKLSQKWKDELQSNGSTGDGMVCAVDKWFNRVTLDIIGETAFDYNFGAIDNKENEVSSAIANMFNGGRLRPSKLDLLLKRTWYMVPEPVLQLMRHIPTREHKRFHRCRQIVDRVSRQLIAEKREALLAESKANRDILSVLVLANVSEDPRARLSDEELVAQMATLILAGHVTTVSTLTWVAYELARHPDYQAKMREEIRVTRGRLRAHGAQDFSVEDLEGMPLVSSCLKETLRFHPPLYHVFRATAADDVIPLAQPVRTASGRYVTEVPVAAGQQILFSVCAYQRLPEVWGEDADVWNPMRFVDGTLERQSKLGLYANLMAFAGGVRGCLGWRFSIVETLAVIVELVEHFRLEPTDDTAKIMRFPAGFPTPVVAGKEHEGPQLLLKVSPVL
ncbi:uncharacterized protein PHACADRAFT_213095 [Phanerochaete carnosa HHB-10118-sp]|uniref:Cytochrome P450 n=1 Tax=Phanerochaete carnosa (strain HHB-10118-sp) TaxID=650164 RepID=K5WLQ9_PHACS|nr:uncharacterized protein PHACADRAFT_213095 [Phanerochaete carnosa HHB-10118-sp]EKM51227.1 hypothetical protein PHACADRAFT_213095 [Phanerochaete carnosa HHB-10118-sp]